MFRECSVSVKMPVVHPVGDSETRKLLSVLAFLNYNGCEEVAKVKDKSKTN